MKKHEAFPSQWLSRDDVTTPVVATISHVTTEEVQNDGGKDAKRIAHFRGNVKPLILNNINWDSIAEISGKDDDDDWAGVTIELYHDPNIMFGSKRVGGVRIRRPRSAPTASGHTELAAIKRKAWEAFKTLNVGETDASKLQNMLALAVASVFPGRALKDLTAAEWQVMIDCRFEPIAAAAVASGMGVPEDDIPFAPNKC